MTRRFLLASFLAGALAVAVQAQDYHSHSSGSGGGGGGDGISLAAANTWTALQTFNGGAALAGVTATNVNGIGTVSTDGMLLENATPAALGAQQLAPRLRFSGRGWGTTAGASQVLDCIIEVLPVQGTVVGAATTYKCAQNAGAFTTQYTINTTAAGTPSFFIGSGGSIWSSSSALAGFGFNGTLVIGNGVPTFSAGFGTTPAIVSGKWYAFRWNVGTGGSATTGTISTTGTAAATGWNCTVSDLANAATIRTVQTASTTTTASFASFSATTGASTAWAASSVLAIACLAF